jgi:hypothetical protein
VERHTLFSYMTLHGRFTISIEQDKNEMVTPNTIFNVACPSIGHNGILNELSLLIL